MNCHLCEEPLDAAPVVGTMSRGGKPSRRVACVRCGLVQVDPPPTRAALKEYYRGDFHLDHAAAHIVLSAPDGTDRVVGPEHPSYADVVASMHRQRARAVLSDLGLQRGARVLEIGCADGSLLAELVAAGVDAYGIEPDRTKATAANAQLGSPRVYTGTIESFVPWGGSFDAVIALHVLEHFSDPLAALGQIREHLRPGGQVWFEVPNVLGPGLPLSEHWMWVHLFDFSVFTSAALLARAGFETVVATEAGRVASKPGGLVHVRGRLPLWPSVQRPYAPHGGLDGAGIARYLAALEVPPIPPLDDDEMLAAEWFGQPSSSAPEAAARRMMRAAQSSSADLLDVWDQTVQALRTLASRWETEATIIEDTPERWTLGFRQGRAEGFFRASKSLVHLLNAIEMRAQQSGGER